MCLGFCNLNPTWIQQRIAEQVERTFPGGVRRDQMTISWLEPGEEQKLRIWRGAGRRHYFVSTRDFSLWIWKLCPYIFFPSPCNWSTGNSFQSTKSHVTFNIFVFKLHGFLCAKLIFCLVRSGSSRREMFPSSKRRQIGIYIAVSVRSCGSEVTSLTHWNIHCYIMCN